MYWFFYAFSNLPNPEFPAVCMPSSVVSTENERHLFSSWSHPLGQCLRYSVRYKQDFCTSQIQYFDDIPKGIYSEENSLFLTLFLPHSSQSLRKLLYSFGILSLWGGHHLPSHSSYHCVCFDHFLFIVVSQISTFYVSISYMMMLEVTSAFNLNSLLWNPLTISVPPEWSF